LGATDAEVKTAYRLYVKAWHPDRFPGDEKSKSAAQEKLKTINSAYDFLNSPSSKKGQPYRPKAATPPAQPQEPTRQKQSSAKQPPPAGGRGQTSPPKGNSGGQTPPWSTSPTPPTPSAARRWGILFGMLAGRFRRALRWVASAFVLLAATFVVVWIFWPNPPKGTTPVPSIQVPKGFTLDDPQNSQTHNDANGPDIIIPKGLTPIPYQPTFSLPNGTEIRKRRHLNGHGELTVENGSLDDAVVHLVDLNTGKTIRTFYVKTDNTFTERQIPPGLYGIYFTTGIGWNVALKTFNLNASYSHFGNNLEYTERIDQDRGKVEKIIYKMSLQPVQGGNAEIESSDKDSFDKMMNDGNTD
jgi:curved DNA-binding protein CbpA